MKIKKENIRSAFGLTQQDMALLLNVSRTMYSLSELGLKNLPSKAGMRQTEMQAYMITPEAKAPQNLPNMDEEEAKIKQLLQKRLKENEYQLMVITRKRDAILKKLEQYEKAAQLLRFLNLLEEVEKAPAAKSLLIIGKRVIFNYTKTKSELDLLLIDIELLQLQQECFVKAIKKLETS